MASRIKKKNSNHSHSGKGADCPECHDCMAFRTVILLLFTAWTGLALWDLVSDTGKWFDGFVSLYFPPLLIGTIIAGGQKYLDMRCEKGCNHKGAIQANMRTYTSINLAVIVFVTGTLFVADAWDRCTTSYPSQVKCVPGYVGDQYWSWIPLVFALAFAIIGSLIVNLSSYPDSVWDNAYWAVIMFVGLCVGIGVDIYRFASNDAMPIDTGYVQNVVFYLIAATTIINILSADVARFISSSKQYV